MTRIVIETHVGLGPVAAAGALLFVGSPAFAGFAIISRIEQLARSARYAAITGVNIAEQWSDALRDLYTTGSICLALALLGLVLILVGRTYTHDVRSIVDE